MEKSQWKSDQIRVHIWTLRPKLILNIHWAALLVKTGLYARTICDDFSYDIKVSNNAHIFHSLELFDAPLYLPSLFFDLWWNFTSVCKYLIAKISIGA